MAAALVNELLSTARRRLEQNLRDAQLQDRAYQVQLPCYNLTVAERQWQD